MKSTKIITICFFIILSNIFFAYGTDANDVVKYGDAKKGCEVSLDPKSSLTAAAISLCIPGIIDNLREFENIKCQQAVCQYELVKKGVSPLICKRQADLKTCAKYKGLLLIPGLIDQILSGWKDLITDPVGQIYASAIAIPRNHLKTCLKEGAILTKCKSYNSWIATSVVILAFNDIQYYIARSKSISENYPGASLFQGGEDVCEKADEIEEELRKLFPDLK